jgi:hypothetical protein
LALVEKASQARQKEERRGQATGQPRRLELDLVAQHRTVFVRPDRVPLTTQERPHDCASSNTRGGFDAELFYRLMPAAFSL